jgi:hypothetical protein
MAITVVPTYLGRFKQLDGRFIRRAVLTITGLTAASANTVPHGLGVVPQSVDIEAGAAGLWGETSAPDATNIYITVGTAGATSGYANVSY